MTTLSMFEKEKVSKLLFKLSIPIVISILVSELYNMVDTFFIGNYVDILGIGALSIVFPIQRIIIALSMMIGIGTSTAFNRSLGAENKDEAKAIINNGFLLVLLIMTPIILLTKLYSKNILTILGASDKILYYGLQYLDIIIFGSIFLSFTIFTSNIMIALGNTKVSIISTSIGAIVNIIIDYILVVKFKYGVSGAAIATVLSQFTGFLYAFYHLQKFKKQHDIKQKYRPNYKLVIMILTVGISAFVIEAEDGILMGVLNNLLHQIDDNKIIILAAITKIYMFLFITLFGIASASQPIVAYNVGANNKKRLKLTIKKTLTYAIITTSIIWLMTMLFAPQIIKIFISDPSLKKETTLAYRIVVSLFPLTASYYISIFYLQALGKAKLSVFMAILRQLVIMLPLSIILVKIFKLQAFGVWISYPIADLLVFIASIILLKKEKVF